MLIGWDAADWQFIDPLLEAGRMPNLDRLIAGGVRGNISTLNPILSPMLWNSIATGKLGDKHDILGFTEPDGKGNIRPVFSTSRKAKAIWNILSQNGLRSGVVNWFASHPPEKILGCIASNKYRLSQTTDDIAIPFAADCVHPPELAEVAGKLRVVSGDLQPSQILPFIPNLFSIDETKENRHRTLARYLAECVTIHNMATYLAEHEQWDLLAVYYDTIDHLGHGYMEYHPPKMAHVSDEDFEMFRNVMTACYEFHDMMLGRLMELAGPETHIILMSDHGFQSGVMRPTLIRDKKDPSRFTGPGADPLAWHRTQGVLVINGPGVKKDELVFGATLLDVTPTILAMLGLPVGDDMDGKVLTQAFDPPLEVTRIPSYEPPAENDGVYRGEYADDPYAAQASLQQLVDLGYIDPPGPDGEKNVKQAMFERNSVLAQIYYSSGRTEKALAVLQELARIRTDSFVLNRIAMCLIDLGRHAEAEEVIAKITGEDVDRPAFMVTQGQVKFAQGKFDEAFELFERAGAGNHVRPMIHMYLGLIHLEKKRWQLAKESFERALAIDPDDASSHDGLAVALRELGNFEDAMFHHMKSVSLMHHNPSAHMNLAQTAVLMHQYDWAIQALKIAAELSPEWPFPHRILGRLYRTAKNDLEKSHEHLKKAAELRMKYLQKMAPQAN